MGSFDRSRSGLLALAMNLTSPAPKGGWSAGCHSFLSTRVEKLTKALLLCTLLLTLVTRSLIPVGYMPDFSGQGKGVLPLVACDGLAHAAEGEHHHHHHEQGQGGHTAHHDLCPFGIGAVAVFSASMPAILPKHIYPLAIVAPFYAAPAEKLAVFSNASPRSPPVFS